MSVKAAMNNVSLAVSVSDEIPLFPEKANVPVPMGHGFAGPGFTGTCCAIRR